ncbi:MAG: hypothetical protein B9S26_05980 [Opitutia bacterium Tous-C4FEB]|nr:MAG: hypothetical protein B9S35_06080 [Opitutae bacterium Tous-C5TDCM]PAW90216.1 MAG: hypothetical protein B9S26_05980 [Opitutae bacterium Tous-C4FEB]
MPNLTRQLRQPPRTVVPFFSPPSPARVFHQRRLRSSRLLRIAVIYFTSEPTASFRLSLIIVQPILGILVLDTTVLLPTVLVPGT